MPESPVSPELSLETQAFAGGHCQVMCSSWKCFRQSFSCMENLNLENLGPVRFELTLQSSSIYGREEALCVISLWCLNLIFLPMELLSLPIVGRRN